MSHGLPVRRGTEIWEEGQFHPIKHHASIWTGEITWKEEADGGSGTSLALGSRGWAIVLSSHVLLGFYLLLSFSFLLQLVVVVSSLLLLCFPYRTILTSTWVLFYFLDSPPIPLWGEMWGVSEWLYSAWYNQTVCRKKKAQPKIIIKSLAWEDKPPELCCMQHAWVWPFKSVIWKSRTAAAKSANCQRKLLVQGPVHNAKNGKNILRGEGIQLDAILSVMGQKAGRGSRDPLMVIHNVILH